MCAAFYLSDFPVQKYEKNRLFHAQRCHYKLLLTLIIENQSINKMNYKLLLAFETLKCEVETR